MNIIRSGGRMSKRDLAFVKREGGAWTLEEYNTIMRYVGDNEMLVQLNTKITSNKYIFDNTTTNLFMHLWDLQEAHPNFKNCTLLIYEDTFFDNKREGAVHSYCGLDYINFFTLPRTVLQDMPTKWQDKFIELIKELDYKTEYRQWLMEKGINLFVTAKKGKKFCKIPEELWNYRHPIKKWYIKEDKR